MAHLPKSKSKLLALKKRQARLAAELRANLHKRKEQVRGSVLRDAPAAGPGPAERPAGSPAPARDEPGTKPKPTGEVA